MTIEPTNLLLFGVGCAVATSHLYTGFLGFQIGSQGRATSRVFLAVTLVAAWTVFWLGAHGTGYFHTWPHLRFMSQLGSGSVGPLLFLFSLGITRPERGIPRWGWLALLTGGFGQLLCLYGLTHPVEMVEVVRKIEQDIRLNDGLGVLFFAHTMQNLIWSLSALAVLLHAYRTTRHAQVKEQAGWVLLAILSGLVSIILVQVVPVVFRARWVIAFGPLASVPTALIIYRTLLSSRAFLDKLQQENAAMDQAKRVAEQANAAKSAFLANMSHELRTPLNAVIGYSEMLAEDLEEDEAAVQDLGRIETSGRYLLALIDDVLDLSKIQAGRIELQLTTVELGPLLTEVESETLPLFTKASSRLQVTDDLCPPVSADAIRVKQILLNLLSNAAKFSGGSACELRTSVESDRVLLSVRDHGIGMDAEQQAQLFGAFNQVHREGHAQYGGTGLGLALSRELALQMDGDITVESAPGEGSCFTLSLPRGSADRP